MQMRMPAMQVFPYFIILSVHALYLILQRIVMRDVGDEEHEQHQRQQAQRDFLREQEEAGAQHGQNGEGYRHDQVDQALVLEERDLCQVFFQDIAPVAVCVLREQGVNSFSISDNSLFHGSAFQDFCQMNSLSNLSISTHISQLQVIFF